MNFSNQGFRNLGLGLLLAIVSCNDDGGTTAPPTGNHTSSGSFVVELVRNGPNTGFTSISGLIYTGPNPSPVGWKQISQSGSCKLYTPVVPFCNPGCGSQAACVEDGKCEAYPTAIGAGKITVKGIKTVSGLTEFVMDPQMSLNYQQPSTLEFRPFAEGGAISMSAAGDTGISAFTLTGKGISPLVMLHDTLPLPGGQPIVVEWTPAIDPTASKLFILVDVSHHGGSKGKIECEVPDNGKLTIPAAMADQLRALGVSGYPKLEATRKAITLNADVKVELVLQSIVVTPVSIPGLVSCFDDTECKSWQKCQPDLQCKDTLVVVPEVI